MKLNKKKIMYLLIGVGVFLLILGLSLILIFDNEDEDKPNVPVTPDVPEKKEELSSKHESDNFVIDNFSIVKTSEFEYAIKFDITNLSDKDYEILDINFNLLREDGSLFYSMVIAIGKIAKKETIHHEFLTTYVFTDTYDYTFNVINLK